MEILRLEIKGARPIRTNPPRKPGVLRKLTLDGWRNTSVFPTGPHTTSVKVRVDQAGFRSGDRVEEKALVLQPGDRLLLEHPRGEPEILVVGPARFVVVRDARA